MTSALFCPYKLHSLLFNFNITLVCKVRSFDGFNFPADAAKELRTPRVDPSEMPIKSKHLIPLYSSGRWTQALYAIVAKYHRRCKNRILLWQLNCEWAWNWVMKSKAGTASNKIPIDEEPQWQSQLGPQWRWNCQQLLFRYVFTATNAFPSSQRTHGWLNASFSVGFPTPNPTNGLLIKDGVINQANVVEKSL